MSSKTQPYYSCFVLRLGDWPEVVLCPATYTDYYELRKVIAPIVRSEFAFEQIHPTHFYHYADHPRVYSVEDWHRFLERIPS